MHRLQRLAAASVLVALGCGDDATSPAGALAAGQGGSRSSPASTGAGDGGRGDGGRGDGGAPGSTAGSGANGPGTGGSGGVAEDVVPSCDTFVVGASTELRPPSGAGSALGSAMAIGDFDGDGAPELALGAPSEARVYVGGPASPLATSIEGLAGSGFGASLTVGDFDGDGRDDLAIGAPLAGGGAVEVALGGPAGLGAPTLFDPIDLGCAVESGARFGGVVASGDLDGDGRDDLVVAAPLADGGAGLICVGLGGATVLVGAGAFRQSDAGLMDEPEDNLGSAVAIGDFDGDGLDDVAASAPGERIGSGAPGAGAVFVLAGADGPEPLIGLGIVSQALAGGLEEGGDRFGERLAAGDLDGDGTDDLVAAAPAEVLDGERSGVVAVFPGGAAGLEDGFLLHQETTGGVNAEGDAFGDALAVADLDADGLDDLLVGSARRVHVYRGRPADLGWGASFPIADLALDEGPLWVGSRWAAADLDGDGAAEALFGLPTANDGDGYIAWVHGTPQPHACLTHGPGLGAVEPTRARVWARADREGTCSVRFWPTVEPGAVAISEVAAFDAATDNVCGVALEGLAPSTEYTFRVLWDDVVVDGGTLRTTDAPGSGAVLRFAVAADINLGNKPFLPFDHIAAEAPAFTMLIGDQIYADVPVLTPDSAAAYARLYKRTLLDQPLHAFMARSPLVLMWDDHEIWNDHHPGAAQAVRFGSADAAYRMYQHPFDPPSSVEGALHFSFQAGDADVYVLDVRSHRTANDAADDADKSMLGAAQKQALRDFLLRSSARWKVIVTPVPMHAWATTMNDSWNGFTTERAELLAFIRDQAIPGVFLISGDQHWAGVFRLPGAEPYRLYEFMPTPLAIGNRTPPVDPGDDVLHVDGSRKVYGVFELDSTTTPGVLRFFLRNAADGATLFSFELGEDELGLPR